MSQPQEPATGDTSADPRTTDPTSDPRTAPAADPRTADTATQAAPATRSEATTSAPVTTHRHEGTGGIRVLGVIILILGIVFIAAGAATYAVVAKTLGDEQITVSEDAAHFGGQHVNTPWEAYAQANVIAKHSEEIAGGKTYAELPQDDPKRATVMDASFLRASLFTSVVAFGVAVLVVGLGVTLILVAWAFLRTARVLR